jgi:predicted acyltransferase
VNASPIIGLDLHSWRFGGVTQRIALCYFAAALLELWSGRRGQIVAIIAGLLGYRALLRFAPVPGLGVPARDIGFMGIPIAISPHGSTANFFMGHLFEGTRDPEGIISTIPAVATTLILDPRNQKVAWRPDHAHSRLRNECHRGLRCRCARLRPGYSFTVKSANGITLSWPM